jgi:hypothetical protein
VIKLLPKVQPIAKETLEDLHEFVRSLEAKDIQSFAVCYVSRDGSQGAFYNSNDDSKHSLNSAVDFLSYRVKSGQ